METGQKIGQDKICTKCGDPKDLSDFYKEPRNQNGRYSWCKLCVKTHKSTQSLLNRGRYAIDFNSMWAQQRGLCAVCSTPMLPNGKHPMSVAVDHDHNCCAGPKSCGTCVRGLIHSKCNRVLGASSDDPHLLEQAAAYLMKWRGMLT